MKPTARYGRKAAMALDTWVKLSRAFTMFNKKSDENIRSFGLTGAQFAVLECLGHRGAMTLGELAKKMLISGGNTTCIIDNLEKDQLIERVKTSEDRRVIIVQLTAKGTKLFNEIFPTHAEFVRDVASVLTEHEQTQLAELLKKLGTGIGGRA